MKNKRNLAVLLLTGTMLLGVTSCSDTTSSLTTQGETDKKSSIVISDGIIGGEVSVVGDLTETNIGSDITITALPDFGYELLNVTVNGKVIAGTSDQTYSYTVDKEITLINANFEKIQGESLVEINGDSKVGINKTVQLSANLYGAGGQVTWESSNEERATVDKNGLVTGIKAGFVQITATSVLDPEATATTSVFVMPKYVEDMLSTFETYDYSKGANIASSIGVHLMGAETPMAIPLSLDLQFDKSLQAAELYNNLKFHLNMDLSSIGFILGLVPNIGDLLTSVGLDWSVDSLKTATDVDIYSLQPNKLQTTVTSNLNSTLYTSEYTEDSIGRLAGELVFSLLPTILGILPSDGSDSSTSLDLNSILTLLDSILIYGEKAEEGISISPIIIELLNTQIWPSVLKAIETSGGAMGSLALMMLPESISEARLIFNYDENNKFTGLKLAVKGYYSHSEEENPEDYNKSFVTITLDTPKEMSKDFATLETELNQKIEEYNSVLSLKNEFADVEKFVEDNKLSSTFEKIKNEEYIEKLTNIWQRAYAKEGLFRDTTVRPIVSLKIIDPETQAEMTEDFTITAGKTYNYELTYYGFPNEINTDEITLNFKSNYFKSIDTTNKTFTTVDSFENVVESEVTFTATYTTNTSFKIETPTFAFLTDLQ